ncbi:AGAP006930-PA-like protein [Anopheles sinensis]|uniref:AGAP006930-PA-like protein n=1 Tax=Anopheles sinensis TaxID=74873 RepID=A0A084W2W3_ANOSI|nr:AGAP006930-PA-like protein [Anopheles sinensis]
MLKTVFPFPISSMHTAANKTYDMPALVCLLCATTVRNFFDFSQKVAAVQKQLEKETVGSDDSMSIAELLQLIKTEPVSGEDGSERNGNESLDMSVDIEAISIPTKQRQNNDLWNLRSGQSGQFHKWTSDRKDQPVTCIDKNEVVESIIDVERRVNNVATRLEQVLRSSLDPRYRIEQVNSFDFSKITNKEEFGQEPR